jgi:hypothetical protein
MGTRAVDFMHRWIGEHITGDFYGPGDAEALAEQCRSDAMDAGYDPDEIEYQTGNEILAMIREAMTNRAGR